MFRPRDGNRDLDLAHRDAWTLLDPASRLREFCKRVFNLYIGAREVDIYHVALVEPVGISW